jgi:hypothetical protein
MTRLTDELRSHPRTRATFRAVATLVGGYLTVSVLTMVAIIVLRNDAAVVTAAVWIRGTIVTASSILMSFFVWSASRGSARAYLRLRLVSAIMVIAIIVIIAVPGTFPLWLKIEQGVCGVILIAVVSIVNGKHLRSSFAAASARSRVEDQQPIARSE